MKHFKGNHIVKDDDLKRTIELVDGTCVLLTISFDYSEISAEVINIDGSPSLVGAMEFQQVEDENSFYYRLVYMDLGKQGPNYKRRGIGRDMLRFFSEYVESQIVCAAPVGQRLDDGSHLVGDGAAFAIAMKRENLLEFDDQVLDEPEETDF